MDVPEGGPIPTTFTFDTLPDYILEGNVVEVTAPEELFDEAFGFRIKSFSTRLNSGRRSINGSFIFRKRNVNFYVVQ